ncbi:MAG: sugar phosphate isomerase/epimerase family protein [Pseudomonadota bacterium]
MLPLKVGAALRVSALETYREWLIDSQRDLELQDFIFHDVLEGDSSGLVAEAKRLLDGHTGRLGIHGPFWGFTLHSRDPDVRKLVAKRMDQALEICIALDGTHMVIHSPYSTWDHNNLDNTPGSRETVIGLVHDTLRAAVAKAEAHGIVLVIENIEDVDPTERLRLAQSFDSDAVRLSIDTGHAHYAHSSTGAPPVDYFVRSAGAMLSHVHLQDADGHADRHWAIGEGTILWPPVFRALADAAPEARLVLELRDPAGIPASMAYLEGLGLAR